jgi:hypothetical protein
MADTHASQPSQRRIPRYVIVALICVIAYVLSMGPVLATAFVLREATGWDGFYAALYLYYPPIAYGGDPARDYIDWWVALFGTVGPG